MEKTLAMTEFTPLASLFGGTLIGASALLLMALNGRTVGISGISSAVLPPMPAASEVAWRVAFLAGLVAAPLIYQAAAGPMERTVSANLPLMISAGLLVGFGSVVGGGCTSGHGVCGLSRMAPRSMAATATFMAVAAATVFVTRHVIGG
jgi:uncharacterized membrane protein YedE/YeeE